MTEIELGRVVAVISDVHGAAGTLERALAECRREGAETVALLGDLVDRAEQADACAAALAGWPVVGVYGNHEREIALEAETRGVHNGELRPETVKLLSSLREHVTIGEVCFAHELAHWGLLHSPLARLIEVVHHDPCTSARITFVGHSHVRAARDEHGALDIHHGRLALAPHRRYLINPGALTAGQFALWEREAQVVTFHHVER